jgi:hypothetical protein
MNNTREIPYEELRVATFNNSNMYTNTQRNELTNIINIRLEIIEIYVSKGTYNSCNIVLNLNFFSYNGLQYTYTKIRFGSGSFFHQFGNIIFKTSKYDR